MARRAAIDSRGLYGALIVRRLPICDCVCFRVWLFTWGYFALRVGVEM